MLEAIGILVMLAKAVATVLVAAFVLLVTIGIGFSITRGVMEGIRYFQGKENE